MNQYPTPTYSTIGIDSRRGVYRPPGPHLQFERPLDESSQLVHHQYNSPLFLYSQRNIDETIKDQTGVSPARVQHSGPLSPGSGGAGLAPAKAGTKLGNIVDITLSPTFQMLQEEEKKRTPSPLPPQEVRTPTIQRKAPPRGHPGEIIHQSGSFKMLMSQMTEEAA